ARTLISLLGRMSEGKVILSPVHQHARRLFPIVGLAVETAICRLLANWSTATPGPRQSYERFPFPTTAIRAQPRDRSPRLPLPRLRFPRRSRIEPCLSQ